MLDTILLFASLLSATVLYLAVCVSLIKAGLCRKRNSFQIKTASALCACFALLVASCSALRPTSYAASACASVAICVFSIAATTAFAHRWRKQTTYETDQAQRIDKLIDEHRILEQETNSLPSICSKIARQHDLTRKEETVLLYVLQEKTQTEISHELVLSVNTVKSHVRNIYRKIGVHSRQELTDTVLGKTEIHDEAQGRHTKNPRMNPSRQETRSAMKP